MMEQSRIMSFLQSLRNTPWLAKLALLWFALTLGAAVASPMVNPQEDLIICTSASMVIVKLNADGSLSTEAGNELSCPLCVVGGATPPVFVSVQPVPEPALAHVQPGITNVQATASTAPPPPSRGPPVLF